MILFFSFFKRREESLMRTLFLMEEVLWRKYEGETETKKTA